MVSEIEVMLDAEKALEIAKRNYVVAKVNAQITCDHNEIVEFVSESNDPYRVCRACGYAERGVGYTFLEGEAEGVGVGEALGLVRGDILEFIQHRNSMGNKTKLRKILYDLYFCED